jgi:hypothetical protein
MPGVEAPEAVDELRFDTTVPAALVHKRSVEQVFITDWMKGPEPSALCTIAAQLPLAHARLSDGGAPYHDPVLIAEVVRQGGLVSAAHVLDVPDDREFLLREMRVELDPLERNRRIPECARMLIVQDAARSAVKLRRSGAVAGGKMHAALSIGDQPSGTCEVVGLWMPHDMWTDFRGEPAENGADPASGGAEPGREADAELERLTGRTPRNTLLTALRGVDGDAEGALRGTLVIDRDDPTFFDHPLDHAPGLLLLAAMEQAAVAATARNCDCDPERIAVQSLHVVFSRVAEFVPEIECVVRTGPDPQVCEAKIAQLGKTCCAATVGLAFV